MAKLSAFVVVLMFVVAVVVAQEGGGRGGGDQAAAPAPTCPASGYGAQAYYGMFGQNGGDGFTSYEIASPCIGKDVRDVATSIGMGRSGILGVKNVIGVQFRVDGTMADGTGMAKLAGTEFQMAYYLPAMRTVVKGTRANGQPLNDIRVFADQYAWNEAQEGRGATAAASTLNDRAPLLKLTPFGAMWSVIEAEGHTVVSKTADGKTVLTGTSPYDGIEVTVTVEDNRQHLKLGPYDPMELIRLPVAVTAKANGHTWGATFADYRGDLEPNVWMIFPTTLKWTLDGKPYADLKVTYFRSNPFIVFPVPDVAKQGAPQTVISQQLPPAAQRSGTLPLRNVQSSYSPSFRRVSPQDAFAMQTKPNGMTPRDADGHPDLSGNWGANFPSPIPPPPGSQVSPIFGLLRRSGALEADQSAMQRGAQWNKPLYKPEFWEKVRSLDYSRVEVDPAYGCYKPVGVPRQNLPARIVQKNGQIWLLNGVENALRILPLDGRKRDENDHQFSSYNGMGLAHWEGDTLVVESVGFNDVSWFGWEGYFHSDRMEVTERFLRQGDLLYYNFTVNDPDVLMEPWTSYTYVRRVNPNPNRQDEATECIERDLDLLNDPFLRG
jgi:hypothetical protein